MIADAVARLVTDGVDLVTNVFELATNQNPTACQIADKVSKIVLNTLSMASAGAIAAGAPLKVQSALTGTELAGNILSLPVVVITLAAEVEKRGECTWEEIARFIELVGARCLRLGRVACEAGCIEEKEYLAMTDEERAKATRPIYDSTDSDGGFKKIGEKPVDKAECERNLENGIAVARGLRIAEGVLSNNVPSKIASSIIWLIAAFAQHQRDDLEVHRERERAIPLANRETIPEEFEDDEVLSQYVCPITAAPIRHPVIDPTTGRMHERYAIEEWIDAHHTSPLCHLPLERGALVPVRDVQNIIDDRLRELQRRRDAIVQRFQRHLEEQRREQAPPIEAGLAEGNGSEQNAQKIADNHAERVRQAQESMRQAQGQQEQQRSGRGVGAEPLEASERVSAERNPPPNANTEETHETPRENASPAVQNEPQPRDRDGPAQNHREATARLRVQYFEKQQPNGNR